METKEKKVKKTKKNKIIKVTTEDILKPRTLARFFGIDPNGEDGMEYQKRVRNEWS